MRPTLFLAAAALLVAGPAAAQPTPPVQTVALYSYGYAPQVISLAAGRPVTLQFVNRSHSGHDFTARQFFGSSRILAGRADGGRIELRGGQSASVTLIPAAGRYSVYCSHTFHKMFGMQGKIVVH